ALQLVLDLALLAGHLVAPRAKTAQAFLQLGDLAADAAAQRLIVGDLAGQPIMLAFGGAGRGLRLVARLLGGGGAILLAHPLLLQPRALAVEIGDRGLGIALAAAFAVEIGI